MGVSGKKFIILFLLLVCLVVPIVSSTSFQEYALQPYKGNTNPDTYNLRAVSTNGVDNSQLTGCVVGFGTDLGVYPIQFSYGANYYSYLLVPTTSSLRVINSNCTQINLVSPSSTLFYGTLSTIIEGDGTHKYVILGYNYTSFETGFYYFTFNPSTELIEFEGIKVIGSDIDTSKFNGVACGWENTYFSNGGCAIMHYNTLVYWDIVSDTITNYTTTYNLNRYYSTNTPYGAVVDFDNDASNEMVFSTIYDVDGGGTKPSFRYSVFDMVSRTFDREKLIYFNSAIRQFDAYNLKQTYNMIEGTPCQIGGRVSDFEMCLDVYVFSTSSPYDRSASILFYNNDVIDYSYSIDNRHFQMMSADLNNNFNMDYVVAERQDITGNITEIQTYDLSRTLLYAFNVSSSAYTGTIHTLLMDIDNDGQEDIIFNNGETYKIDGSSTGYMLPFLSDSTDGYLVAGDLNHDYKNEIIYSDSSNIYIYSVNATNDYITTLAVKYSFDTDGGQVYQTFGVAYNGSTFSGVSTNDTISNDVCLNNVTLLERYLNGYNVMTLTYNCSVSYTGCSAGICYVGAPVTTTTSTTVTTSTTTTTLLGSTEYCHDSDGDNIKSIGVINTDAGRFNDICINGLVREHICTGVTGAYYETSCPIGTYCENGRCRQDSYLNFSSTLVDIENPEDAINEDARGLLPDVYFGTLEFFRHSFKPIFALLVIVMIALMIFMIADKLRD